MRSSEDRKLGRGQVVRIGPGGDTKTVRVRELDRGDRIKIGEAEKVWVTNGDPELGPDGWMIDLKSE